MSEGSSFGPEAVRFLRWLRAGFSGCGFARQMANEAKGLVWLPTLREIDDESLSALERVLDEATHKRAVVIAVLPNHRTHGSVVELANALLSRERWTVCRRDYMAHARHLLSKRKHTTTWAETTSEIRSLLTDPPEDSVSLREISFCLPDVALSRLQA